MANHRVTVFGGSGFLGRQIVKRLADDGADVRVAVRRPEHASFLTEASGAGRITPVYADVWDEASVAPVVDGSDAVINTVGHYVERGKATFEAIHGHGAMHVARASAMAGVRRLVHISGRGADPTSDSGPRIYTYKALVQLVLTQIGRKRLLMPVPYFVWEVLAGLPNRPVSRDQVKLMKKDNVVSAQALTSVALGIEPTPVEAILPTYLGRCPRDPSS